MGDFGIFVWCLPRSPIETNCQCSPFSMLGDDVSNGVQEHSRANDSAEDEEELLGVKFHGRSLMMAYFPEID